MVEISPYYYISKWEYYEDRADQLAVIADALAVEVGAWQHDSLLMSDKKRADCAEAKLRELIEATEWRDECSALYSEMYQDWLCDDEPLESLEWMESIFDISKAAEDAYQVALKVAKEE